MPFRTVSKKDEERIYLERFKETSGDMPVGEIEECEEPDFVVAAPDRRIGIEITKLFWDPDPGEVPRQAVESVREQIANKAQQIHAKSNLPSCHVSVHFRSEQLKKKDADRVAADVFDVVSSNFPEANESTRIPPNSWTECRLPDSIHAVSVYRLDNMPEPFYAAPQSGWIPSLDSERDVQRVLSSKNKKVDEYRKKCDEIWLVINVGFGTISGEFDVPSDVTEHTFESPFDRVYLLSQSRTKCWRLKTGA